MKSFYEIAGFSKLEFVEYNAKCLVGVTVGYVLYKSFPEQRGAYLWILISILLSITHDNDSKVAYDRMKGNIVGSSVGLLVFFLHNPPNLLTICIGVMATIAICSLLKLITVARTALVAFIIVVIYEESHSSWTGAAERLGSVVIGCLIGLVINYAFRKMVEAIFPPAPTRAVEPGEKQRKSDGGE